MSFDGVSLHGSLTRDRALVMLLGASTAEGRDAGLLLLARGVDSVDVVAATATRMRIARHLRSHPAGAVEFWLPGDSAVAARYLDLLDPLPDEVALDGDAGHPPAHFTLLPATQVADSEDARLIGEVVYDSCLEARIARTRAGYAAEAAMELADNALVHAAGAPDPPVVAVSSFGRERIVEVAVTDAGTAISENPAAETLLGALPGRALEENPGFLALILNKALAAGVEATVQVYAGTGRLLWTRTQHRTDRGLYVPGMTVVARIPPERAR